MQIDGWLPLAAARLWRTGFAFLSADIRKGLHLALEELTPRMVFTIMVGFAIVICFLKGGMSVWHGDYSRAVLLVALAVLLTFVFFRTRKIAFALIVLSFLLVGAGTTALFHPTLVGIAVTLGSALGILWISRWQVRRFPNLKREDWKTLFDKDPW